MAASNKQPKKKAPAKKAPAKNAPAKKAAPKKAATKKAAAPKKKPGRPAKTSNPGAEFVKVKAQIENDAGELVDAARTLVTSVSGVAPQTAISYVAEIITANDVKSASLRKRVLKWFKRS